MEQFDISLYDHADQQISQPDKLTKGNIVSTRVETLRKRAVLGAAALSMALLGVVAGSGFAWSDDEPTAAPASDEHVQRADIESHGGYDLNRDGQTFGSLADEWVEGAPPDLVRVMSSDGVVGYVRYADLAALEGPEPSSPQEAVAMQRNHEQQLAAKSELTLPMYREDGTTLVGQWDGFDTGTNSADG